MSLLQQIQESIVQEGSDLGSVLLKLRLLAARLGSGMLEEWVKHESGGYPSGVAIPSYRMVRIDYRGTFLGSFGAGVQNAPIPTYLIQKYAGESWVTYEVKASIAAISETVKNSGDGSLYIDVSNLILLLNGKIYEDYSCNEVTGTIPIASFYEIQQTVRSRILELTIELEKSVPGAMHVAFGTSSTDKAETEQVQQIFQQIIYGNVATAVAGGAGSKIAVAIKERDNSSLIAHLIEQGIAKTDATELVEIMASEEPLGSDEPFGEKARGWIANNLKKAAGGTWKVGLSVATKVLTEAALKYYGLK